MYLSIAIDKHIQQSSTLNDDIYTNNRGEECYCILIGGMESVPIHILGDDIHMISYVMYAYHAQMGGINSTK